MSIPRSLRTHPATISLIVVAVTLAACAYYWAALVKAQTEEMKSARLREELRASQLSGLAEQEVEAALRDVDMALPSLAWGR